MASLTTQTALAYLSAIELDLRQVLESYAGDLAPEAVLSESALKNATRRRADEGAKTEASTVDRLVDYLDYQDSYDCAVSSKAVPEALRQGLKGLATRVQASTKVRNRAAHNRPLEIDDLPLVIDLAMDLQKIPGSEWSHLREVASISETNPGLVLRMSANLIVDPEEPGVVHNLPDADFEETTLLGRKKERADLSSMLRGSWPVISVLGDGGVGKTALALQACFDLVQASDKPFQAIVWVTAKNARLTSTEIQRIDDAVQDSLGLFASAAETVGEPTDSSGVVDALLKVLRAFPTLLVLDNVETVLDEHFYDLLRDIPRDSKVLITSRIGVRTESPYRLDSLQLDDAKKLIRILTRRRNIHVLQSCSEDTIEEWCLRMKNHPAYLKWFVAGVQAGQLPEHLLADSGLLLQYCMSNVFEYLSEDARYALRAMLTVPGSHTLAELAALTEYDASRMMSVYQELTTTNFVRPVQSGPVGTTLALSDFAQDYLSSEVEIEPLERSTFQERQKRLYELGGGLLEANRRNPYSPETLDIRGAGDYSAAALLRQALIESDHSKALAFCAEADRLAPTYHEVARVEGYVQELAGNLSGAFEAYARAKDAAPSNSFVAFFFGRFLVNSGYDPRQGINELRRAAVLDQSSMLVQLEICQALVNVERVREAFEASQYVVTSAIEDDESLLSQGLWWLCRSGHLVLKSSRSNCDWNQLAEDGERLVEGLSETASAALTGETLDMMLGPLGCLEWAARECPDQFLARSMAGMCVTLNDLRQRADAGHSARHVGEVQSVSSRGFGFVRCDATLYYFHARSMLNRGEFDQLTGGAEVVFEPGAIHGAGEKPPAEKVRWIG